MWEYLDTWYAVIPVTAENGDAAGTWLWRLDNNDTWTKLIILSTNSAQADAVVDGAFTHILLYDGESNSEFITIEFVSGAYQIWSGGSGLVSLTLGTGVETATIDIDSNGIIWLAYESDTDINVRWSSSASNYSTWSDPEIVLATGVDTDDICAVTAFDDDTGKKIGVMWSNQNDTEFGFKYHVDGTSESSWTLETAIHDNTPGLGVADDHINFAVQSDGTIYAAVKTGYNTVGVVQVGLLVRPKSGPPWQFYNVRNKNTDIPTRPLALLNEAEGTITVVYIQDQQGNDVMFKSSDTSSISFSPTAGGTLLFSNDVGDGGFDWSNISSTKQNYNPDVVVLASITSRWRGKWTGYAPLPVELAFFAGALNGNKVELRWRTETEVNNYGFDIERTKDNSDWLTIGFVEGHGNSNSPKQYSFLDSDIELSGNYYFRLKQIDNDGTYEYSDVVSIEVGVPDNFYLSQNYPNPFNPSTRIDFTLPEKQLVSLKVYNTLGELVAELVNEVKEAGRYSVTFDTSSVSGELPSGIYVYRLQTPDFATNKKMILLK